MQFACDKCSTRYAVPDEKVVGKRVRTQCRKCGAQILIEGPMAPPSSMPPGREERLTGSLVRTAPLAAPAQRVPTSRATPVARDDSQWTVAFGPTERRKMSTAELVEAYARNQVTDETLVWKEGMDSWQPPFDVPVIALALQARGLSPSSDAPVAPLGSLGLESARPPPPAASPPAADAAARRAESFRSTHPATPSSRAPKPSKVPPAVSPRAQPPRRGVPRPPVRSATPAPATPRFNPEGVTQPGGFAFGERSLTPGPVPDDAWQEDDEATHVVKDRPPSGKPDAAPITVRGAEPPTVEMPQLGDVGGSSGSSTEFEFENEATAVIAPDKARALLQAETQRDAAKKPEASLGFIFDDEATEVIGPERATELLSSDPEAAAAIAAAAAESEAAPPRSQPPPKPPRLSPYPGTAKTTPPTPAAGTPPPPTPAAGTPPPPPKLSPYPQALPPGVPEPGPEPSVVVTDARRIRQHADDMTRTLPPKVTREMGGISHEKTRLVRVVTKKKDSGMSFWVILAVALAAAATGGFLMSQMIQRHGAPAWMKLK